MTQVGAGLTEFGRQFLLLFRNLLADCCASVLQWLDAQVRLLANLVQLLVVFVVDVAGRTLQGIEHDPRLIDARLNVRDPFHQLALDMDVLALKAKAFVLNRLRQLIGLVNGAAHLVN